jgi:hypothetical protein
MCTGEEATMFTVVVTGSREWNDRGRIEQALERLVSKHGTDITLINGTARGADRLCAAVAHEIGMHVVDMPADWDKYGRGAGFIRNAAMLDEQPDLVLAFWDGSSKGTKHTIDEARKRGLNVCVCTPEGWEL